MNGVHQVFELPCVRVEAVEAGCNRLCDVRDCTGYVLTFSNGRFVCVTGDTSTSEQMAHVTDEHIDYAFCCTDGVYNMGPEEAARCAEMVAAGHHIPYHNDTSGSGKMFDGEKARAFTAQDLMVVLPGEEIRVI